MYLSHLYLHFSLERLTFFFLASAKISNGGPVKILPGNDVFVSNAREGVVSDKGGS